MHTHTAIEIKVGNGDPIDIDTNNDKQGDNNTDKPKQDDGKLPEAIDEDIIKMEMKKRLRMMTMILISWKLMSQTLKHRPFHSHYQTVYHKGRLGKTHS